MRERPKYVKPERAGQPTPPVPAPDAGLTEALAVAIAKALHADWCDAGTCSYGGEDYDRALDITEALAPVVAEHVATQRAEALVEAEWAIANALPEPPTGPHADGMVTALEVVRRLRAGAQP